MSKTVAIVQSNYIPWRGYFDLIAAVDEFVLYDDMQYTRRDWRNRNRIKTADGLRWLTVPVRVKGKYHQRIRDTEIDGTAWAAKHWHALEQNYRRSACFADVAEWLEPIYRGAPPTHLSTLNRQLIEAVCRVLGINTTISNSWDYAAEGDRSERLASLCQAAGGSVYVSGPAAKAYLDENVFARAGIEVRWFDYAGYPAYPQLWGDFEHGVSVLDLLFNCGRDAPHSMRFVTCP
ncbi:MAG: WbqC family protein [Pseudomonadota bacterium]